MQTEREKKPKERREPELPHCTQAIARGWPLLPRASFTCWGRKWWAPEGWGFCRWIGCLGPTAAKGADTLRISALVLWAGIQETQERWSRQAYSLHPSSWQPHVSAGLPAMGREDNWAREHRNSGLRGVWNWQMESDPDYGTVSWGSKTGWPSGYRGPIFLIYRPTEFEFRLCDINHDGWVF